MKYIIKSLEDTFYVIEDLYWELQPHSLQKETWLLEQESMKTLTDENNRHFTHCVNYLSKKFTQTQ